MRHKVLPSFMKLLALSYLLLMLFLPALNVFYQAFSQGISSFLYNLLQQDFLHALKLTCEVAIIVVPLNAIFGLCTAWCLARMPFPGKFIFNTFLDLPFSISPVIVGLMNILLYGRHGLLSLFFSKPNIIFAFPGIVMVTTFVTLPFVVREVLPVLEHLGKEEEEAAQVMGANQWNVFIYIILPNLKDSFANGLILTNARAVGEFGAVSLVSGNIINKTQTLTLFVEHSYKEYETQAAFSAAAILACLALLTLITKEIILKE